MELFLSSADTQDSTLTRNGMSHTYVWMLHSSDLPKCPLIVKQKAKTKALIQYFQACPHPQAHTHAHPQKVKSESQNYGIRSQKHGIGSQKPGIGS